MKPKILFCLALALIGGIWGAFCCSDNLTDWLRLRNRERGEGHWDGVPYVFPHYGERLTYVTKLKTPWTDTKVVLYRAKGERVELPAKAAVYTILSTRNTNNERKGADYSMAAFIDPATKYAYVGGADDGRVETNEFVRTDSPSSMYSLTHSNFYIQTDSGIVSGETMLWNGAINCDESLIKQAQPGETLEALIDRFEQTKNGSWPHDQRGWEINFENYFRDGFFSSDNLGAQVTPIENVSVASGKLRLDFDSLEYLTKGSVWLDLKSFQLRRAVEFRPVQFNLRSLGWGLLPALIAIMAARASLLRARKAGRVAQCLLSGVVLAIVTWSLLVLFRIHVLGAWPTHLPILRPVFALGDWAVCLPVIGVALAVMITAAQASVVQFGKQIMRPRFLFCLALLFCAPCIRCATFPTDTDLAVNQIAEKYHLDVDKPTEQDRAKLAHDFPRMTQFNQFEILEGLWPQARCPEFTDALLPLAKIPKQAGDAHDETLCDYAFIRLLDLKPEAVRPLILEDLRRPRPMLSLIALKALPDKELPELDDVLLAHLSAADADWERIAPLFERYASARILPEVVAFYQTDAERGWACSLQTALLRYWLKYDRPAALLAVEKAVNLRTTGCYKTLLGDTLHDSFDAEAETLARKYINDPDANVVDDVKHLLNRDPWPWNY